MAKYSKKDYELVAEILGETKDHFKKHHDPIARGAITIALMHIIIAFAETFEEDNPRFDANKFKTESLGG